MQIDKLNNDFNGNPRYALKYCDYKREGETYDQFVKRANKLGGKRYDTKHNPKSIVVASYNLDAWIENFKEIK